jgi:hypothetical protein
MSSLLDIRVDSPFDNAGGRHLSLVARTADGDCFFHAPRVLVHNYKLGIGVEITIAGPGSMRHDARDQAKPSPRIRQAWLRRWLGDIGRAFFLRDDKTKNERS